MPSQEEWILGAARLFPSPNPDHIRTSDIPLVLICLDIDDEDLLIRRALGVGRVREIPISNLVRVLSPILPAENSASERYTMFKTFDKYENGVVNVRDLQRVAVGAGLLTAKECERIMSTLANTGNGMTFDHWCYVLKDETGEEQEMANSVNPSPAVVTAIGRTQSLNNSTQLDNNNKNSTSPTNNNTTNNNNNNNNNKLENSMNSVGGGNARSRGSSRIGGSPAVFNISPQSSPTTSKPTTSKGDFSNIRSSLVPPIKPLDERESVPSGM
jgi:hypothetical protein